jgi:hypothetical protein
MCPVSSQAYDKSYFLIKDYKIKRILGQRERQRIPTGWLSMEERSNASLILSRRRGRCQPGSLIVVFQSGN